MFHIDSIGKEPEFPFANMVVVNMSSGDLHKNQYHQC
jgi:hypothetical protein